MFFKIDVLKILQISLENMCVGVSFQKDCRIEADTGFSCEVCLLKNTSFYRTPPEATSGILN